MELIQSYLDIHFPSAKIISLDPKKYGYQMGTISDGASSLDFAYKSVEWSMRRQVMPVYTLGNFEPRSFARGNREVEFNISIFLDSDHTYQFLSRRQGEIVLKTELFEATGIITDIDYRSEELLMAHVTFVSAGNFTLLQKEPTVQEIL
jgi:hypothetical protein